jgi:AcrR family transcriptional regulator
MADSPAGPAAPVRRAVRRDAVENRARLIQAASDVFGEHGTDVSLDLVGAEAGLGMATLYRHFPTKNELVAELVQAIVGYLVQVARAEVGTDDGRGLERWLVEYADVQSRKRGILARMWAEDPAVDVLRAELFVLLDRLLADARARGRFRPEAELSDVLLVVFSLRGIAESTTYDEPGAWRRQLAVLLAGLASPGIPLDAEPWQPRRWPARGVSS